MKLILYISTISTLLFSIVTTAQVNWGANTLDGGLTSSALGDGHFVTSTNSFATGQNNSISGSRSFAFGLANNVGAQASGAFGTNNQISTPNSYAFGYSNAVSGSYSMAVGRETSAEGAFSYVFGNKITNNRNYSFLIGYDLDEPAFMVTKNNIDGPTVGIGTDDPQSRLDIRLADKQEIIIQSEVPNTYGGISFRHSDGTENWRIRSFSNFPGGYGNILGINSSSESDLWLSAGKTLIGSYFDFDDCTDCDEYELFVRKGIRTEKVKIDVASGVWADYVFEDDYELKPLTKVEQFINQNGHLPGVPSTEEMQLSGLDVVKMDALLLQKIEELTLYVIEMQKQNTLLSLQVEELSSRERKGHQQAKN